MLTQGEGRLRVDLPHVKGVVAAFVDAAADLAELLASGGAGIMPDDLPQWDELGFWTA